ncbi:MAG: class D beta-lactamase [Bacteroidota bacterium]
MKTLPILFLAAVFACNCPVTAQQPTDSVKTHLNRFIDQWHLDAARGNFDAYFAFMSPGGVYIGTDPAENWTTAEFAGWCRPHFDRKQTWSFNAVSRNIFLSPDESVAWFDELLTTQMGLCRGSGVIQKRNGDWKIEQYVLSATIPNDMMRNVTGLKRLPDSLLLPYFIHGVKDPGKCLKLKSLFDEHRMTGTILIFDPQKKEYYGYNPGRWDSGYLPASTFKIANALIGLETGATDTAYIFKWNGEKRRLPEWEQNLKLGKAFAVSCVPCFQELARKIGFSRMNEYLQRFSYGAMDLHPGNIDSFWLEGNSRITPRQQVDFIQRLYEEKLPVSRNTMRTIKGIMINERNDEYTLSGKTGWAIRNGSNRGWFVGYLETSGRVYYVAILIEPLDRNDVADFAAARKLIAIQAFRMVGLIR